MENAIKYIEQRSQAIAKYSDKLRQSIKDIDTEMTPFFKDAGIVVFDDEFKYENEYDIFTLGIYKAEHGRYAGQWGIFLKDHYGNEQWIGDAPRGALILAVKRIIPLLEKYSRVLVQMQNELEFMKMADSIKG